MAIRAIIADHQKMFAEGIQAILTDIKHNLLKVVGVAYDAEELRRMLDFPVDLLILELSMFESEGIKFITWLKKTKPETRVIVLSSYGDPQIVREAFINGIDGYVIKSNNSLDLLQCIEKVMEGSTYLGEGLRLSPELKIQKKSVNIEHTHTKVYEDRFLLKQLLTKREKEILSLIVQFKNNKVIAQELFISDQTAAAHRKRIMKKFGVNNTVNLIKFSLDHELV